MTRKPKVLDPNEIYTFAKYFDLPYAIEDILADLDCTIDYQMLALPQKPSEIDIEFLSRQIQRNIRIVELTSEIARREALCAPILQEVCGNLNIRMRIEYTINVNNWLRGTLDYYIPTPQNFLIIEAKRQDLIKGFTQLAVELIALDRWTETDANILYGVVTTGTEWQFGRFDRTRRHITQDLKLYRIPEELTTLTQILEGLLAVDS
ncbi:MAG TPA: hypothetical protein DEP38_24790 [Cyanobacteria bacterium UBA9226]|nr:hypothetical protein [Cyanobacteria bacterium UBA11153]HCA97702.1 hypothetical protein [Cyanobacteria bacterium UBA9226]